MAVRIFALAASLLAASVATVASAQVVGEYRWQTQPYCNVLTLMVVQQGAQERSVYLPAGPVAWFDFHTGAQFAAGRAHTVAAPWSTLPLFARAGACIAVAESSGPRARHDDPPGALRVFRPGARPV